MNKSIICMLSFVLVLGLLSAVRAEVIDSFETGVDAWEIMDPAETLAQSTEGVTDGTYSMQRNFTSGWHEIDLGGVSVDTLNANDILEVDVTTSVTAEQMGWWLQQVIVLQGGNAAGSYYLQSEVVDVASPDGTPTTTTVSFEYRSLLADGPITDWAKIRLVDNTGPGPNGVLYYDNLRAVTSSPPGKSVVYDFETGAQGWGNLKDGTATTVVSETHADGGTQSLRSTIDEAAHEQAQGGWSSPRDFTADDAAGGLDTLSFWYRADDPDFNGGNFVFHWIMSTESWTGGGWYGNGLWGVVIADGQWHQQTVDLSILGEAAGGWQGAWGDQTAWDFRDDLLYSFELMFEPTDGTTTGSNVYVDDIQFTGPPAVVDPGKSTDTIIGDWEQDLDGWVVGGGADALFNDHNGVTLGDYSLDVYIPNGDWNQDVLTLNLIEAGLLDIWRVNQKISVDVTRLVADWPVDDIPGWNGIHMIINAGGDGWSIWELMDYQAGWQQTAGDQTLTATWDYSPHLSQIDFANLTWCELKLVSNANDPDYAGWVLFYLDNMRLTGGGGALDPAPASGGTDVPVDATLSWTAGAFASSHHLYLGQDMAKVQDADMDSDPDVTFAAIDETNFDPNGFEFKTQYFWRVDEVNEANPDSPWTGPVWQFTTANFVVADDFEAYNDIDPGEAGSNRIFDTWTDGFGIETNGALVGYDFPPHAEQTIVRNGGQSMPLYYDNTGAALQSEAERVWVEPQDWTVNGFNALRLYTHGGVQSTPAELYVTIEDSAGISHTVANPDSAIFTAEEWKEWSIPLADFSAAGVDVTIVTKLAVGVADLAGQAEANGLIYIDDIRVGFEPIGLVAHYAFDNNVDDSSGNGYHGTLAGDPNFPVAYVNGPAGFGMAMQFDGEGGHQHVDLGTFNPTANTDQLTVALWARWDGLTTAWQGLIGKRWGDWDADAMMWQIEAHQTSGAVRFQREGIGDVWMADALTIGQWYHLAVTFDGTTAKTYIDGALTNEDSFSFGTDKEAPLVIGSSTSGGGNPFNGALDEVRIYDIILSEAEILQLAGR